MNKSKTGGAFVVAAIVLVLAYQAGAEAIERFKPDQFAIGLWVDPPIDEKAEARYKELAGAHFNLVIGGFGARTPEQVNLQLELCEQFDLKALVYGRGVNAADLPDGPACWGYGVRDEPSAKDFPVLRARADAIRAARPGKLPYINLFPNYANAEQLGTDTYDAHVARFVDEVQPDVLSMDHYPRFAPGVDGRAGYCDNLAVMRKYSLANSIPFWNFFNIMPYGPHTDPTEAQIRWQAFTSIAYGAKGVLYFCYYTPGGDEFPKGGAIIGRDDRRTTHYYHARRLNEQLKAIGPVLMKLTSTGVYRVEPGDDPAKALAESPIRNILHRKHDPKPDYLVGVFRHEDGRRVVLLNNYHFAYSAWPTVEFDVDSAEIREIYKWSGEEIPLTDASPAMDGLQISLEAAEGRLFILPE